MATGLNIERDARDAIIAALEADGYFIDNPTNIIPYYDNVDEKILPVVVVRCHGVKNFENSAVVVQSEIVVLVRTKTPDDLDHADMDAIYPNVLRIMRNTDQDVFDAQLPAGAAFAFNGFAEVSTVESFNDEKREHECEITCDARFWIQ